MLRLNLGIFLVALTTLMLELTLIRIFDSLWYPNMAYMVITLALFCFSLAGVYLSIRPVSAADGPPHRRLAILAALFAAATVAILPGLNELGFNFDRILDNPAASLWRLLGLYLVLSLPFFFAGMIFTLLFSTCAQRIRTLYFWDLFGAGVGSVILVPFLPHIGPGGLLFLGAGMCLLASGLFARGRLWMAIAGAACLASVAVPFLVPDQALAFKEHVLKRGLPIFRAQGLVEVTHWDPVSKIDVVNHGGRKDILYDGGSQTSVISSFDGDYEALRKTLPGGYSKQFTHPGVLVSHYLRRDSGQQVLVIGSAGGQEVKAAVTYGAAHVDAVELVGFVVDIGKHRYADFNGGIYNDPRVHYRKGEGRSFLRATNRKYDIIQVFSNHTSSSIAAGNGAMSTAYLQTVEAYIEFFRHLGPDGILHINHHVYPRMVATAAAAWKRLGGDDFRRHVAIWESRAEGFQDNLPTMMIKMSPWEADEIAQAQGILGRTPLVEDPVAGAGMLSDDFYTGELSDAVSAATPFRVAAPTDDRPFFNFLRKSFAPLTEEPERYLNYSTASLLNSQLSGIGIPRDVLHLVVTGIAAAFFTIILVFAPLLFAGVGRGRWPAKAATMGYFCCLGAGFIIIELMFIQMFLKLIGYPLYTYSAVVFAMLASAGTGSAVAGRLGIDFRHRWHWPFVGIAITGILFWFLHQGLFEMFLTLPVWGRVALSVVIIAPLGFFLGMPFPIGVMMADRQPRGAIAWAWGLNGLFTVVGGYASMSLSLFHGFQAMFVSALLIYGLAVALLARARVAALQPAAVPLQPATA